MSNDLRQKGIDTANRAVVADNSGNHKQAFDLYEEAVKTLQMAKKYERNPELAKMIHEKCSEYVSRMETIKKQTEGKGVAAGGGGSGEQQQEDDDDDDKEEEQTPLTEEDLKKAEEEMDEELSKLVGMDSVKKQMKKVCKGLAVDIKRRLEQKEVMLAIRHMVFTGNPGVGKTTISRLIAKLFFKLGVASSENVIEVQKGDLVAGYVNQTAAKTLKKIKEAKGGILFVDEAYQLTQALMKGQTDFAGEAIDEMMKVMNKAGKKATTFCFAGYSKEMAEFETYNAGIASRIKYRFHFDDYSVPELVQITNLKLKKFGYLKDVSDPALVELIEKNTNAELRSRYNGRLIDNLVQWAREEMDDRLDVSDKGDKLVTFVRSDFETALKKFHTTPMETKKVAYMQPSEQVLHMLRRFEILSLSEAFAAKGYRNSYDFLHLDADMLRKTGINFTEPELTAALRMISEMQAEWRKQAEEQNKRWQPIRFRDVQEWLKEKNLSEYAKAFAEHKVDFSVLPDLSYDDLKEIDTGMKGKAVGARRALYREISQLKEERDVARDEMMRTKWAEQFRADAGRDAMGLPTAPSGVSGRMRT